MAGFQGFWRWYDRVARADFGLTLLSFIFDWRTWLGGLFGGGGVTFIWAAMEGRSPLDVWLMALVATTCAIVIIAVVLTLLPRLVHRPPDVTAIPGDQDRPPQSPLPDFPIRELFFHINPNILDPLPDDESPWQTLGNSIRDAFALGRLKVWGRVARDSFAPLLGDHSVPVEIEPAFWQQAEFTYTFFHDDQNSRPQTHISGQNRISLPDYTDLKVNRAQALTIWPQRTKRETAEALDELFAKGVAERNRLMPTIERFNPELETAEFKFWNDRVLALLAADCVTIAERSSFRTLNLFQPIIFDAPGKNREQAHLEAIWNEKLRRLRLIIDRVGNDH